MSRNTATQPARTIEPVNDARLSLGTKEFLKALNSPSPELEKLTPVEARKMEVGKMNVSEIMTKNPALCVDTASLQSVARMMADHDCGCIPVVDDLQTKRPIGTITDRDITVRTIAKGKNPSNMVVGEIMTDQPVTISEDASFDECCQTMEKNQIRRIVVVNKEGECVGIVAQADVARKAGEHETAELVKGVSASSASRAAG